MTSGGLIVKFYCSKLETLRSLVSGHLLGVAEARREINLPMVKRNDAVADVERGMWMVSRKAYLN